VPAVEENDKATSVDQSGCSHAKGHNRHDTL
jgi:hypothetical protein